MAYTVDLETFHGPLDLLLYLVKKNEVDILDIPIARIAEQFRDYLLLMQSLDIEVAGEFLTLAAELMVIKSRMLLPSDSPSVAGEEDPRRNLVKQLLEYRRFKEAAAALEEKAERHAARRPRQDLVTESHKSGPTLKPVELWDLVSAFARLAREIQVVEESTIVVDDTPQHVYEAEVRQRARIERRISLRALFTPPHTRSRLIGLFLAILELIKQHEISLEQIDSSEDIWIISVI